MENHQAANIAKYEGAHYRENLLTNPIKIAMLESFRSKCRDFAVSGESVLDIGGGSGMWTQTLEEEGIRIQPFAIDLSLSLLKDRKPSDVCICGNMERLPFLDKSFDRTFFFASLHHVKNPGDVLKEASRVLRPGGHVVLREPTSLRLLLLGRDIESVDDAEFCFSILYLLRIIKQSNFKIVSIYSHGFFKRLIPIKTRLVARLCHRLDNFLNQIPGLRNLGMLGDAVTVVAQKQDQTR